MKFSVIRTYYWLPLALAVLIGCKKDKAAPGIATDLLTAIINTDTTYQTIAGFGGANRMWGTQFLKPTEAKLSFGTGDGELGMSIFRVRIASDPAEWPLILESVKEAQVHGVKILASPWSPPPHLKNNNSDIGGYLLPEKYGEFKDHINDFVSYMKNNGVDIYAISLQNEPDIQVSYESCDWSTSQFIDFISNYGPLIENTKIAAPESFQFNQSFTNALLNDADCANNFDIVAGHIYGGGLGTFPLAEEKNKEIWMTEYLLNLNTGNAGAAPWTSYDESAIWNESLKMLETVHDAMTNNWNAYIWWYIQRYYSFIGDGEQGTKNGEVLKRGYAFSHYAKFVRPGFVRVDVNTNKPNNLDITAYQSSNQIVVVILNVEDNSINNFRVNVPALSSATAYETSLNANQEKKEVEVSGGKVDFSLGPKSVTTVVIDK